MPLTVHRSKMPVATVTTETVGPERRDQAVLTVAMYFGKDGDQKVVCDLSEMQALILISEATDFLKRRQQERQR